MKNYISISIAILLLLSQAGYAQYLNWAYALGKNNHRSQAFSVATGANGDVYTVGFFEGDMDFNPGMDSVIMTSSVYGNSFILRTDANSNFKEVTMLGTGSFSTAGVIKIDASGNKIIAGFFTGQNVDFDPDSTTTYALDAIGSGNNAYLLKMDATGKLLWARKWNYNKDGGANEEGPSMTLDGSGNIICAGYYVGNVDFDPDTSSFFMNATQENGYISKFDGNGKLLWAKQIEADTTLSKFVKVTSVTADPSGNIFVGGCFAGKTDFDPDTTVKYEITAMSMQAFVLKLDANGKFIWVKKIGKDNANPLINFNNTNAVLADASGNVYATGSFMETISLGSITLTSNGNSDIYITKIDASGNFIWAKAAGSIYNGEYGYRMTLDNQNNLIVSGIFHNTIYFDGKYCSTNGYEDIFVAKFTPSGGVIWVASYGGSATSFERVQGICVNGNSIYSVGRIVGTVNFDPNGIYNVSASSIYTNYRDFFIQKMSDGATAISEKEKLAAVIYPNPATTNITIDFPNSFSKEATLSIYDLQGRKLMSKLITHHAVVDVSQLPKGFYMVNIVTPDATASQKLTITD